MFLVSTGKTTVLSDFANLNTRSIYQHKNGETTDFQPYTNSNVFVEVNKKAGLHIMRIKETNIDEVEIQRVRKLRIENAYCVACARQSFNEIAVGLSNGQVRIYNYTNSEMVQRYTADKLNGVIFVDYNAADEYISAVYENGLVNIFGTKTNAKLETINIDSHSTLARFHPTKRFHLSIASYKGVVSIHDMNTKLKIFHSADSHTSPCRDLCMSPGSPHTLISVGYDCVINIFDTRKKIQPHKLRHGHPLSTVAASDCGTYFCVGNLKGELITYDLRNTKAALATKKVHEGAVNRVAFLPPVSQNDNKNNNYRLSTLMSEQSDSQQTEERNVRNRGSFDMLQSNVTLRQHRDSFCDFLNLQTTAEPSNTSTAGRDSFDWEALSRRPIANNRSSSLSTCPSPMNGNRSYSIGDSFENKLNSSDGKEEIKVNATAPLRECNSTNRQSKLFEIREEPSPIGKDNLNLSSCSDKENPVKDIQLQIPKINAPIPSTPTPLAMTEIPMPSTDVLTQIRDLRVEMETRLQNLESELKFDAERNKWQMFTHISQLSWQQTVNTEDIKDALAILLQTDPFVAEFKRLKEENQVLKSRLDRLAKN